MANQPRVWVVVAQNLPEHAANAIHTDAGAQAQGFPSALVAGVTTYAYLTRPLVAAWGTDWLTNGGGEMRFRAPVFAGRSIECRPTTQPDGSVTVEAIDATEPANPRASFTAVRHAGPPPELRAGEPLPSRRFELSGRYGPDYGARAGEDLALYADEHIVHPAVWPALANNVFSTDLVNGSWIHTRSIVRHHGIAHGGDTVDVHAVVIERFERGGTRAIVDLRIERDGRPIATLEHEAIIDLSTR